MRWLACLFLACSSSSVVGPTLPAKVDASADATRTIVLELSGAATNFFLVRGESVRIPYVLSGVDWASAGSVVALGLPAEVSADPTTVTNDDGYVTIRAASDAILGDYDVALTTTVPAVSSTAAFRIAVVDVDGSVDPTLGIVTWPKDIRALAAMNDALLVATTTNVSRFHDDLTPDSTFTPFTSPTNISSMTVCADGTIAVTSQATVTYLDATGVVVSTFTLSSSASSAACLGHTVVAASSGGLQVIDPTHTIHFVSTAGNVAPRITTSPTAVFAMTDHIDKLVPDAQNGLILDPTFAPVTFPYVVSALTADASSRLLMSDTVGLTRRLADGTVDGSFSASGLGNALSIVAVPSSQDAIVIGGSSSSAIVLVRIDGSGAVVTTFGDKGVTQPDVSASDRVVIRTFDSQNRLWIAVSSSGQRLLRLRINTP